MKSLGVCYWYVTIQQCRYMKHGLKYIMFYAQKDMTPLTACSGPLLVHDKLLGATAFVRLTYWYFHTDLVEAIIQTSDVGVYITSLQWVNSLWHSDAIWRQRSGSTLTQVMACCLTAPSHYLNQCWLIVMKSNDIHIKAISQEMLEPSITKICLKIKYLKFYENFPGANELTINSRKKCFWIRWNPDIFP